MRQVALDTETTGIGHEKGHRIIEIGCMELIDRKLTGNQFHVYLNPNRDIEEGAFRVHGISTEFLQDKPFFKDVSSEFIDFVKGAELIIHNAPFDVGFLNAELNRVKGIKPLEQYCSIVDTLVLARKKHPGQRNNLDALCKRYEVDNSSRQLHGALLDAQILAHVFLAMTGGQVSLLGELTEENFENSSQKMAAVKNLFSSSPLLKADENELALHHDFIEFLVKKSGVNNWDIEFD